MRRASMLITTLVAVGVLGPATVAGQAETPDACDAVSPLVPSAEAVVVVAGEAGTPEIFDHLVGVWEGEGALFGRPATFAMTLARELDGRFLGLEWTKVGVHPVRRPEIGRVCSDGSRPAA